ncbi:hypothetical protein Dimus_000536 [Dionaea muscipula]
MDGLMALVFRAIKSKKTRRQYECLSTGAPSAQLLHEDDIFEPGKDRRPHHNQRDLDVFYTPPLPEKSRFYEEREPVDRHRRFKSIDGEYGSNSAGADCRFSPQVSRDKQLVRFRSHRMLPSCLTGA